MAPAKLAIADGHRYVEGRSQETARGLLAAAESVDMEGTVATAEFGYVVPDAVFKAWDNSQVEPEGSEDDNKAVEFDPSEATVQEVNDYLAGADEAERGRVLAAEKAGKNRSTVSAPSEEGK